MINSKTYIEFMLNSQQGDVTEVKGHWSGVEGLARIFNDYENGN